MTKRAVDATAAGWAREAVGVHPRTWFYGRAHRAAASIIAPMISRPCAKRHDADLSRRSCREAEHLGLLGIVAFVVVLAAPAGVRAQGRVGVAVGGEGPVSSEVEAATRAACAAQGMDLVPADEMRAAIHFTAPSGTLTDDQARTIVVELGLRALFIVFADESPSGSLLVQVRLVRAAGVASRFGEVSRDTLAEWIARLIREAAGGGGAAASPPAEPPSPGPAPDPDEADAPAPPVAPTPDPRVARAGAAMVAVSFTSTAVSALEIYFATPSGHRLSTAERSSQLRTMAGDGVLTVSLAASEAGTYAVCARLVEPDAAPVAFRGEVRSASGGRAFEGSRTEVSEAGAACSASNPDFVTSFRIGAPSDPARGGREPAGVAASAARAPDGRSPPELTGATMNVNNRGSARICRAEALRAGAVIRENVLAAEIEPREEDVRIIVPEGADTVVFYSCAEQRLAAVSGDARAASIDYTEIGHFPIYLRLSGGLHWNNSYIPGVSTDQIPTLVPSVTLTFAYLLEPGGIGIGAIARFGVAVTCFYGNCGVDFGGMYLAGLAMPSGVIGIGASVYGGSAIFTIGIEQQLVRFTNDFFLTSGAHIGVGGAAGSVVLMYGAALGLGGTLY